MKQLLKQLVWAFTRHRPGDKPNILLVTSRRSGSTWIMETIAASEGVRYIDQPLSLFHASSRHRAQLPDVPDSQFIEPETRLKRFMTKLLEGSMQVNAPWDPRAKTFHWNTDRILVKELDSKPVTAWMAETFELQVVYSTRHPIPTCLSIIRNGWGLTARAYLDHERFTEQYLTVEQRDRAQHVLEHGSEREKHVVNWCLENRAMVDLMAEHPEWLYVPYEDVMLHPESAVDRLGECLDLRDTEAMREQALAASRSTRNLASVVDPEADDRQAELGKWRTCVSVDEDAALMELTAEMGVPIYHAGSDLPDETIFTEQRIVRT